MPVPPTYPGVYIEEVPSGTRTITGVATSIAAFVGRTLRGPLEPTTIFNWTEYEHHFGGLWKDSTVSYAIRQFFQNGGGHAIVLRTVDGHGGSTTTLKSSREVPGDAWLRFEAATPGATSNGISLTFAAGGGAAEFGLTVTDTDTTKLLDNVLVSTDPAAGNYIGNELDPAVHKVRLVGDPPADPPAPGTVVLANGLDSGPDGAVAATAAVQIPGTNLMTVTAANPGRWGDNLEVVVSQDVSPEADADAFTLVVREFVPGSSPRQYVRTETFLNLTATSGTARFADDLVAQRSSLVDVTIQVDGTQPPAGSWDLAGGSDGAVVSDTDIQDALESLDHVDLYNLLCVPPLTFTTDLGTGTTAMAVEKATLHRAVYVADAPSSWKDRAAAVAGMAGAPIAPNANTAVYFPRLQFPDPLLEGRLRDFAPCGAVAGIIARTDAQRGIWKAPAGLDAGLLGVRGLAAKLNDDDHGQLNPLGLNVVRTFPVVGTVVWGSRTLRGADILASEWKYLPVRRVALYIEESLYRGTQWAVFEPNDEPLWAQLRMSVGSFMHQLFRKGAFQGSSPREAYLVKCDSETTTQADIDLGIVNVLVGFAPLKPAEFVFIKLQQLAGETAA